jgi:protein-disulfide isomerase
MNSSLLKIVGMFLILIVLVAVTSFGVLKDFGGGKIDKEEIEKIIAEYIKKNPQVILDSVSAHQQNAAVEEEKKAQNSIKEKLAEIENNPSSPVAGNKKGDVVIVEFFDYACGYCKKVLPSVTKIIEEDKNVKFVFKELPILGANSELAAKAALAVYIISPDKYFEFHKQLMEGRISGQDSLNNIAKNLGIDVAALEKTMKSDAVEKIISDDRKLAAEIGIRGTPAFIVGGEFIPGAIDYNILKELVDKARGGKS